MANQPSLSRMGRLIKTLGGEENLPPKFEPQASEPEEGDDEVVKEDSELNNAFEKLQSMDNFIEEEKERTDNWWDAMPQLPRQAPKTQTQVTQPTPPYILDDSLHFDFDSRNGDPAPLGFNFCPFTAVTKFCYKFVRKDLQQPIATAFFDEGKIWNREWDL